MARALSEQDLGHLSFHDFSVYGYAAVPDLFEIRFDVDAILEWLAPEEGASHYRFRVAPATLLFENAGFLEADICSPQGVLTLNRLIRSDFEQIPGAALGTWLYTLEGHNGVSLRLRASGLALHLRAEPVVTSQQCLSHQQRGGVSFDLASG